MPKREGDEAGAQPGAFAVQLSSERARLVACYVANMLRRQGPTVASGVCGLLLSRLPPWLALFGRLSTLVGVSRRADSSLGPRAWLPALPERRCSPPAGEEQLVRRVRAVTMQTGAAAPNLRDSLELGGFSFENTRR